MIRTLGISTLSIFGTYGEDISHTHQRSPQRHQLQSCLSVQRLSQQRDRKDEEGGERMRKRERDGGGESILLLWIFGSGVGFGII